MRLRSVMSVQKAINLHLGSTTPFIKIGNMHTVRKADGEGGFKDVPLFDVKPYRNYNNSRSWMATINSDGIPVHIDLIESDSTATLVVFPPEMELTPDQLVSAEILFMKSAEHVVALPHQVRRVGARGADIHRKGRMR